MLSLRIVGVAYPLLEARQMCSTAGQRRDIATP
jgi:hypothetical protein